MERRQRVIDLSKVEDLALREELRAKIKADKQQAIQDRLARVKTDEEIEAKLAKLKEFEETAAKAKAEAEKQLAAEQADKFLSENNLTNLESFKQLKAHDEFLKIEDEDKKKEFIKELKEKQPSLFKGRKSVLGLSNAELNSKTKKEELKVY